MSDPTVRYKVFRAETKVLDGNRIEAVMSTEAKDRDGDIIRQEFWDLRNFRKHPVLISSHNYMKLTNQIGHWENVRVDGKKLVGVAHYYTEEGNDEADWGYKLAEKGRAAYSVGFLPDMAKAKQLEGEGFFPTFEFRGQELLETSQVTIPSNPQALQRMKALGLHPVVDELVEEMLGDEPPTTPFSWTDEDLDRLAEKIVSRMQKTKQPSDYVTRFIAAAKGGSNGN